jgi:phosphomannomutase
MCHVLREHKELEMATPTTVNPHIFAAYDVRGIYPIEINEGAAYRFGRALVLYLKPAQVAVGRDIRLSSPTLAEALMRGITEQGADAIDVG